MASRSHSFWPVVAIIVAIYVALVALPQGSKSWAPGFIATPDFHLGLDLAGGTQLDFRISEDELDQQVRLIDAELAQLEANNGDSERIAELKLQKQVIATQRTNLVEAIRTVLERRVNALGVSEAVITPSYVGDESHLLVECPGDINVQHCIDTVGKTIQLEFKEEFTEANAEFQKSVEAQVAAAMVRVRGSGVTLQVLGQDLGDELGIAYQEDQSFFKDELPRGLESLWERAPGSGIVEVRGGIKSPRQTDDGQIVEEEVPGVFLAEVTSPKVMTGRLVQEASVAFKLLVSREEGLSYVLQEDVDLDTLPPRVISTVRAMKNGELKSIEMEDGSARVLFLRNFIPGREEVSASHILVSYKGATEAPADVSRTKEEALTKAQALKKQLTAGAEFAALARAQSDGPSAANGGDIGVFTRGQIVPAFENVAFTAPVGQISEPVETPFGYHLIRVNKAASRTSDLASFDVLQVSGEKAKSRADEMLSSLEAGNVRDQQEAIRVRFLFFSLLPSGWKDTALDGKHFRTASVVLDPTTNIPVVQIIFDAEGGKLFQEMTRANIGKRIAIFVGGEMVSAPVVQSEIIGGTAVITGSANFEEARLLAQDLNTGAIPAPIHLIGQRTVEATLGAEALQTSLKAALIGIVILLLYMLVAYRFLGLLADVALLLYAVLFIAILKLPLFLFTDQYIVLTLAGAAGLILSIGMAVDANVLVFERVKEELRKGRGLKTAIEVGFEKAWPSVRDSNVATLITCALLFLIGTSIVRGFAVTLSMGVLISMFTGIVVSRWLSRWVAGTKIASNPKLFPGMTTTRQE